MNKKEMSPDLHLLIAFLALSFPYFLLALLGQFKIKLSILALIVIAIVFLYLIFYYGKQIKFIHKKYKDYKYSTGILQSIKWVGYVALLLMTITLFIKNTDFRLFFAYISIILYQIDVFFFELNLLLPDRYKFNKKQNHTFFDEFKKSDINFNELLNRLYSFEYITYLLKPYFIKYPLTNKESKNIIDNLNRLKANNFYLYTKLYSYIKVRSQGGNIWGIVGVTFTYIAWIIGLNNTGFFTSLLKFITQKPQYNFMNIIAPVAVLEFAVMFFYLIIKNVRKELNKDYYIQLLMYFEKADDNK